MPKTDSDGPKKITKGLVEKTEPEGPKKIIRDTEMKGFGLRVTPNAKTFFLERRIRGGSKTPITITIGQYPQWTADEARTEARRLSVEMDKGIDPRKKAQAVEKITLQMVYDEYMQARNLRPVTRQGYALRFKYLDWGRLQVDKITEAMVAKKHIELGENAKPLANSIMKLLSALMSFAQVKYGEERIPKNPVRILAALKQWYPEKVRQGVIKRHELAAWFRALEASRAQGSELTADYLTFVLLTGARRDEAQRLAWSQVDFEGATVTFVETKTDPERTVPLTRHIRAMLERRKAYNAGSPWVFDSPKNKRTGHITYPHDALRKINAEATAELQKTNKTALIKVSVHDLRRTYGTILESLEVSIYALKNLMGHTMKNDITGGHYVVIDIDRLRDPAQRLEDTILRLAGVVEGNVVQFPKQA